MRKLMQAVWTRSSLYLPAILMGALALGTYWLVRSTPLLLLPEQAAPARHEPDYFMRKFSVKTFDNAGRLKNEVLGIDARHFPDTDTLEVDQVRIRSFDEEGRLTTARANRALANNDVSEVQLFGDAQVKREPTLDKAGQTLPRIDFRSEFLHALMDQEILKSNKPVQLMRGRDHFTADTLEFDNLEGSMQLQGHVRVTLVPGTAP